MKGNGHQGNGHGHVTETPDVSHIKNVDVTHERSDVDVGGLLKFVGALTLTIGLVAVLMWALFLFLQNRETQKESERPVGPMALTAEERLPAEPRLQSARGFGVKLENGQWVSLEKTEPQAEYRVLRAQWESQLNCVHRDPTTAFGRARITAAPGEQATADSTDHGQQTTEHEGAEANQQQPAAPCISIDQAMKMLLEKGLPARKQGQFATDPALPTPSSSGRVASVAGR